ncbi:hypothetical protein G9A89_011436 [Geosiphon pyriformis]|nr:hypothetical protein G9A89_011436 [Geosiphon pyriformis]
MSVVTAVPLQQSSLGPSAIPNPNDIYFGPEPFVSSQETTSQNFHRMEHRYIPISSSPLAHSEVSVSSSDGLAYLGESVSTTELLQPHHNNPIQHQHRHSRCQSETGTNILPNDASNQPSIKSRQERLKSQSEHNRRRTFIDNIDKLDLSYFYGGTTLHHESPYDCILPFRNGNAQAPVLAFHQTEGKNRPATTLPFRYSRVYDQNGENQNDQDDYDLHRIYTRNRYTAYDHNNGLHYMDSFLEGSMAYGVQPTEANNDNSEPKRRPSLLKRLSTKRKSKDSDVNVICGENEEKSQDNNILEESTSGSFKGKIFRRSSGDNVTGTGITNPARFSFFSKKPNKARYTMDVLSQPANSKQKNTDSVPNFDQERDENIIIETNKPSTTQTSADRTKPLVTTENSVRKSDNNQAFLTPEDLHQLRTKESSKKPRTSWIQKFTNIGR